MENIVKIINVCYNYARRRGSNMNDILSICDSSLEHNKSKEKKDNKIVLFFQKLKSLVYIKQMLRKYDFSDTFESNKDVLNGKLVIKNTRITPEIVFNHLLMNINKYDDKTQNEFIQKLLVDFPSITADQYIASILYYIKKTGYIKLLKYN